MQDINKPVLFTTLLLTSLSSYGAIALPTPNTWCPTPLAPRVSITGLSGDETTGAIDAMVPMLGNVDSMLYGDAQGKVGNDHAWMGSLGAGYRQVTNPSDILGAYLFIDRNVTENKNTFWMLSPGVESLGYLWDARANGYFPISSKQEFDHSSWGDELGLSQYVVFSGHQQFDRLFNFYEEVGPGADAEIGRIFPCLNRLAVYGGGYYFNIRDASNIKGVEARVEYPINRYFTAMVNDTYDNQQHNTIMAGIRVSVGKPKVCPGTFDIHQRMLDQVERGLGALYTGSNIPSVKVRDNGRFLLQRDNIWFFTSNSSAVGSPAVIGCGTYEHPCFGSQFTQANVDAINAAAPHANFYFNTGNYPLSGTGRIALNNGQSIYGRTADYKMAAQGNARPVFTGGFDLEQGNNTLDSFQLFNNNAAQPTGIDIANANNVLMNNLWVGANNTSQGYVTALTVLNSHNVNLNNSTVNAFEQDATTGANSVGIQEDNSDLTLNRSAVNATANAIGVGGVSVISSANGIRVGNNSILNLTNFSTVNANGTVTGTGGSLGTNAVGLVISGGSDVNINRSTVNANASADSTSSFNLNSAGIGIDISENSNVNLVNSHVNANAKTNSNGIGNDAGNSLATGIFADELSHVGANNSTINAFAATGGVSVNSLNANSFGINAMNGATLDLFGTDVNSNAHVAGDTAFIATNAWGLNIANGEANIVHSQINAGASSADIAGTALGVSNTAFGIDALASSLAINNSQINAVAAGFAQAASTDLTNRSFGMNLDNSNVAFNNSTGRANTFGIGNAQSMTNSTIGIFAENNSTVFMNGSTLDVGSLIFGTADPIQDQTKGIIGLDSDFYINNSTIAANSWAFGNQFTNLNSNTTGIDITNGQLNLDNSHVSANIFDAGMAAPTGSIVAQAEGIAGSLANINIDHSTINSSATVLGTGQNLAAISSGITLDNSFLVLDNNSQVNAQATVGGITTNAGGGMFASSIGIAASGIASNVRVEDSSINAGATVVGQSEGTVNALPTGISMSTGAQLFITDSQVSANAKTIAQAGQQIFCEADGIVGNVDTTINIDNCAISGSSFILGTAPVISNFANGVIVINGSDATITNSLIAGNAITIGNGTTASSQFTGADGIFVANGSTLNVFGSFIEAGSFTNLGGAGSAGIETLGSTVNAQNNIFLSIAATPTVNGAQAEGILDDGGSTITDINNTYYLFPIEFPANKWVI